MTKTRWKYDIMMHQRWKHNTHKKHGKHENMINMKTW